MSRARCNTKCCAADPGPRFPSIATGVPDQRCIASLRYALHRIRDTSLAIIVCLALSGVAPVQAQSPDIVLLNGKIVVYDAAPAQALAVRDGKIAEVIEYLDTALVETAAYGRKLA